MKKSKRTREKSRRLQKKKEKRKAKKKLKTRRSMPRTGHRHKDETKYDRKKNKDTTRKESGDPD